MVNRYPTLTEYETGFKIQKAQKSDYESFAKISFTDPSENEKRKKYRRELESLKEMDSFLIVAIYDLEKIITGKKVVGEAIFLPITPQQNIVHLYYNFTSMAYKIDVAYYMIHLLSRYAKKLGYEKIITTATNNETAQILRTLNFNTFDLGMLKSIRMEKDIKKWLKESMKNKEHFEFNL